MALGIGVFRLWPRLRALWAGGGFFAVLALSLIVAVVGKARFAASYADDQFAGQMWFFGWIGAALGFAGLIHVLSRHAIKARN